MVELLPKRNARAQLRNNLANSIPTGHKTKGLGTSTDSIHLLILHCFVFCVVVLTIIGMQVDQHVFHPLTLMVNGLNLREVPCAEDRYTSWSFLMNFFALFV